MSKTDRCVVCNKIQMATPLLRCASCKNPNYLLCSKTCQRVDWKNHKYMCHVPKVPPRAERMVDPDNVMLTATGGRPKDKYALIHTYGLFRHNHGELLTVDVPVDRIVDVMEVMASLVERSMEGKVREGYKFSWGDSSRLGQDWYWVTTIPIAQCGENHTRILESMEGRCHPKASFVLVKTLFEPWKTIPSGAPYGKTRLQESILSNWLSEFPFFKDGNERNLSMANLEAVPIEVALAKPEQSSWHCGLTMEQAHFVRKHWDHFCLMGLANKAKLPSDKVQAYANMVAENLHEYESRYQRGERLVDGNYTWDLAEALLDK